MKKKIIFGILILVGFISVFSYENIDLYKQNNLNKVGIAQYGSGNYQISQMIFSGAQLKQSDAILEYNKANSLYKQGEQTNDINEKIKFFKEASLIYSWLLLKEYNSDTEENKIFVDNILETLSTPKEETIKEGDNQENNSGEDSEEKKGEETNEEKKGDDSDPDLNDNSDNEGEKLEKQGNIENEGEVGEQSSGENKSQEDNTLTDEQKKQIERYSDQLKKSELYNQKYFNKKPQEINRDINDLMRDPFLEDGFVRGGEKDW